MCQCQLLHTTIIPCELSQANTVTHVPRHRRDSTEFFYKAELEVAYCTRKVRHAFFLLADKILKRFFGSMTYSRKEAVQDKINQGVQVPWCQTEHCLHTPRPTSGCGLGCPLHICSYQICLCSRSCAAATMAGRQPAHPRDQHWGWGSHALTACKTPSWTQHAEQTSDYNYSLSHMHVHTHTHTQT